MKRINQKEFKSTLKHVFDKVNKDRNVLKREFPHVTERGAWETTEDGYWSGGFWVGMLWLTYKITGDEKYKKSAYKWLKRLESRKNERNMLFDLGFMFFPSFVLGYEITNDDYLKSVALEAADTLSTRTIIDVMMELPLLWWAYKETGEERFFNIAYTHSKRTIEEFIREDYSTVHVIDFELETGEIIRKSTDQVYSDDSCWSRGQAWAIYGFALAYKTSKDEVFLKVAENLAEYYIENLPEDYVPYWDFNDPKIPNAVKDSSAAAIASSVLLSLYESNRKERYKEVARKILNSLSSNYLSEEDEGILKHGCFYKSEEMGVDESLI
jgi:unsaturated chondroitin disaccharide hydrolase